MDSTNYEKANPTTTNMGNPGLHVELDYLPAMNLALQQNAFPVIRELTIRNQTGRKLHNLTCNISTVPPLLTAKPRHIAELEEEATVPIRDIKIELDYEQLLTLADVLAARLVLSIQEEGALLFHQDYPLRAFAIDQWLGANLIPELIAAFVTPNMEVISILMTHIADELQRATGSSAIQGYQKDRRRAYAICNAIYRSIQAWGIHYSNPAASFGTPGQRVRFADAIYKNHLATCLDSTLLFASVMEQCGLHPVILFQKDHAYIGCHLVERYFPDLPMDDLQAIRKLTDLDEFLVFETTGVTSDTPFATAENVAKSTHLRNDAQFLFAIDVVRARHSGVHPLPLKRTTDGIEMDPIARTVHVIEPQKSRSFRPEVNMDGLTRKENSNPRIARWQQKLLDLSLRNRLLNIRETKQVIPILSADVAQLENQLYASRGLSLKATEELLGAKDMHEWKAWAQQVLSEEQKQLFETELQQCRVWSGLSPVELKHRLTMLSRLSKSDMEEGGINTLFLAIGLLEWQTAERDIKSHYAPLLLIPVRLQRNSMKEGFTLSRLDEDTVINVTLLELLRREHKLTLPGLDPLPADESGVDVALVLQIFRQAIKEMKGWEIHEKALLSIFSFNKFIMWNDLANRTEALKAHPLVSHLIESTSTFDDQVEVFPPDEIAQHLDASKTFCPMSADSSQLTAVKYSEMGKNFVLHGPPGTGKSQTITNIIAHNLALGKKVLFVSEKKAALDVVHRRLSSIGLRPFCLELHSNKAGKADVLKQFSEALSVVDTAKPTDWEPTIQEIQQLTVELNEYVRALHHTYPNGLSAYHCFTKLMFEPNLEAAGLIPTDCLNHAQAALAANRQQIRDLAHTFSRISSTAKILPSFLAPMDWTPLVEQALKEESTHLINSIQDLCKTFQKYADVWGIETSAPTLSTVLHTALLAEMIKSGENIPAGFLTGDFEQIHQRLQEFQNIMQQRKQCKARLAAYQMDVVADLDCDGIERRIRENQEKSAIFEFLANRALCKELSGIKKLGGGKLQLKELAQLLPNIRDYKAAQTAYDENAEEVQSLLGSAWRKGNPDWTALTRTLEAAKKIHEHAGIIANADSNRLAQLLDRLAGILPTAGQQFAPGSPARDEINQFLNHWNAFQEKLQQFSRYAPAITTQTTLAEVEEIPKQILENSQDIRNALLYLKIRANTAEAGLAALVQALETERMPPAGLPDVFETAYHARMLHQILESNVAISHFIGSNQNERIKQFSALDKHYTTLSSKIVFARLSALLPRGRTGKCPAGTELSILKRECEKRARHKPVRQLLAEIPSIAPALKPCFLMSPLSIAQYLPPEEAAFDLIVFDEASQIPVWDAIGAIARGKQLIVVGDPKQLPPTSFFQKSTSEEMDDTTELFEEDMESILDECLAIDLHSAYLNWHYRSRHESLIAFSNHHYYEDRLYTFPAAHAGTSLGVRLQMVQGGTFDRGRTRTNRKEAKALVDYIFEYLPTSQEQTKSMGVVTFSQSQRELIEDLIEHKRSEHPEFEAIFSDQCEGPFFVKNLENVQGDERDIILFSIGYAPDAKGYFPMNFGALNRAGGERRLNVAITRAKEQVVIFSSFHASQIDLNRTQSVGATHLKHFLNYAENGTPFQPTTDWETNQKLGLSDVIKTFLEQKGFTVKTNVGQSGYRLDLAVIHPAQPDSYLLAIECDGTGYHQQRNVRDRDHLRSAILRQLGWQTYRAWSMDWAFSRKQAEADLLEAIHKAQNDCLGEELQEPISVGHQPQNTDISVQAAAHVKHPLYQAWKNKVQLKQNVFYDPGSTDFICGQIAEVIQTEAPICENLLQKRIIKAWGFSRSGTEIQGILHLCADKIDSPTTQCGIEKVFWRKDMDTAFYKEFRISDSAANRREIDEIPPEELANAMYEVLLDLHSCPKATLYRETVRLLGFNAATEKMEPYLACALDILKQSERI